MSEKSARRLTPDPFTMFMHDMDILYPINSSLTRAERSQQLQRNVLQLRDTTLPQETKDRLLEEVYGAGFRIAIITVLKLARQVGFDGYELPALIPSSYDILNGCINNYDPEKSGENGKTQTFQNYLITSLRIGLNGQISTARNAPNHPFTMTCYRNSRIKEKNRAQEGSEEATSTDGIREGFGVARRVPLEEAMHVVDPGADPEAAVLLMEFKQTLVEQIIAALRVQDKGRKKKLADRDVDASLLQTVLDGNTQSQLAKDLDMTKAAMSQRYRRLIERDLPGLAELLDIADIDLGQE